MRQSIILLLVLFFYKLLQVLIGPTKLSSMIILNDDLDNYLIFYQLLSKVMFFNVYFFLLTRTHFYFLNFKEIFLYLSIYYRKSQLKTKWRLNDFNSNFFQITALKSFYGTNMLSVFFVFSSGNSFYSTEPKIEPSTQPWWFFIGWSTEQKTIAGTDVLMVY